ncbi:MAG: carbohydrate ABC transporter permease, partial [Christensenellaceae bacterium]
MAIFIVVMLIYPLFRFGIMWGYINIRALWTSFTRYDLMTDSNIFVGTLQYEILFRRLATDEYTRQTLVTSILYFPVTCGISLPLSIIFAYFLFKKVPGATVYRVIFYLPSILPIAVLTMSFKYSFGPSGFVDPILNALGFNNLPVWWGNSTVTPIMVFVY